VVVVVDVGRVERGEGIKVEHWDGGRGEGEGKRREGETLGRGY